jgi:hypothetical protein
MNVSGCEPVSMARSKPYVEVISTFVHSAIYREGSSEIKAFAVCNYSSAYLENLLSFSIDTVGGDQ